MTKPTLRAHPRARQWMVLAGLSCLIVSAISDGLAPIAYAQTATKKPGMTAAPAAREEPVMIRINCDDSGNGARVTLNGQFKGECPVDINARPGVFKLRAVKKVDESHERVFEQEFELAGGTTKRVTLEMGVVVLNAEGQKRENERLALELAEKQKREEAARAEKQRNDDERLAKLAEQRRIDSARAQKLVAAAQAGDTQAMLDLADMQGREGVPAVDWIEMAAKAGHPYAQVLRSPPLNGSKADHEVAMRMLRVPADVERDVSVEGEENYRALIAEDPFFEVPGGSQPVSWTSQPYDTLSSTRTCQTRGRFTEVTGENDYKRARLGSDTFSVVEIKALAGLVEVKSDETRLFDRRHTAMVSIQKLQGKPFPLTPGKRFSIQYVINHEKYNRIATRLTCGLETTADGRPAAKLRGGVPLVCVQQDPVASSSIVGRYVWNESSGCILGSKTL